MSNDDIKKQLKKVKNAVLRTRIPENAGMWKGEGVDHINIGRSSSILLGRMLGLDFVRQWKHPLLGQFRTLNSLWYFLKASNKSDAIRGMAGFELKNFVSQRCGGMTTVVPNFRAVIADSAYQRVKACPEIAAELINSELPFDCYNMLHSGVCTRFEHSGWFTGCYEEIRRALKEDRAPNFRYLHDAKADDIYEKVLDIVSPNRHQRLNPVAVEPKPEIKPVKEHAPKKPRDNKRPASRYDKIAPEVVEPVVPVETVVDSNAPGSIKHQFSSTAIQDIDGGSLKPIVVASVVDGVEQLPVATTAITDTDFTGIGEVIISVDPASSGGSGGISVAEALVGDDGKFKLISITGSPAAGVCDPESPGGSGAAGDRTISLTDKPSTPVAVEVLPDYKVDAPNALQAALAGAGLVNVIEPAASEPEVVLPEVESTDEAEEVLQASGRYAPDEV